MSEPNLSHLIQTNTAAVKMIQHEVAAENAMQVETEQDLNQYFELNLFNPMIRAGKFKDLDELKSKLLEADEKKTEEIDEPKIVKTEKVDEAAARFQKNNFELSAKTLVILRARMTAQDSPEDVLIKVTAVYSDPSLADEALDFLLETADPETHSVIQLAKERLNTNFEREIKAGRNIGIQSRTFSETGLGSPTSLRDMYRDITGTARDPLVLFNELS